MPEKFVFRFAPLLELRERVEREKQRAFASVRRERDENRRALDALGERHRACLQAGPVYAADLQYLAGGIEMREARQAGLAHELERAGGELALANRERRILEKLKERRRAEFERQADHREALEIDESNARGACPERSRRVR